MVAPASGAAEIPVPEAAIDMWMMAQLDKKDRFVHKESHQKTCWLFKG